MNSPHQPPTTKNEILGRFLVTGTHDFKSVFGLLASAIVSTIGVYGFLNSVTSTHRAFYIAVVMFVVLLVVVDTIKRATLTKYFNGLLKKCILSTKAGAFYLIIAIMGTLFMFTLDVVGSYSSADYLARKYTEQKNTDSKEFEILEHNAEVGAEQAKSYTTILKTWESSRDLAYANCNDQWSGWKAKYKAECKNEWLTANPMPQQTATGAINVEDYKAIASENEDLITKYGFYIAFALFTALTAIFQYLTIASIYDDYKEIDESLTAERIEFINDTIKEHVSILAEHEQKVAEIVADSEREKKNQDRKFTEVGEAIAITHKKKMVDTRAKTVKRIANNVYVPVEESKAGFVLNPLPKEQPNSDPLNEKDSNGYSENEPPLQKTFKTLDDMETIYGAMFKLWKNGTAKKGDELNRNISDKFKEQYYETQGAYKENGKYYANMNFDEAFLYYLRLGWYHWSGGIREHEAKTGKKVDYDYYKSQFNIKNYDDVKRTHEQLNESVKPNGYNQTVNQSVKPSVEDEPINITPNQSVNRTVITEPLTERLDYSFFNKEEKALIKILWSNGKVKPHDSLVTRLDVLKQIGDTKVNTTLLRNLYKKLLEHDYIYKRVGYFAKVGL